MPFAQDTVGDLHAHDVSDPVEDAYARGLTFTAEQAAWLAHHINNGAMALSSISRRLGARLVDEQSAGAVRDRLTRVVFAASLGVRKGS